MRRPVTTLASLHLAPGRSGAPWETLIIKNRELVRPGDNCGSTRGNLGKLAAETTVSECLLNDLII